MIAIETTFECDRALEPNVALRISERDLDGALVGFYKGFWYPDRGCVELYPTHNPYCWWRVARIRKVISERIIKAPAPAIIPKAVEAKKPVARKSKPASTPVKGVKSSTAQAMRDIVG